MKKYLNYLLCFMMVFGFSIISAKAITADGQEHTISATAGDLFSGYYCNSDNANVTTKEVRTSDGGGVCNVSATSAQNATITYGNSHSGTKNTVTVSFTAAESTDNSNDSSTNTSSNSEPNADAFNICNSTINPGVMAAFKLGSIILLIVKIVVPIILIVLGMIDMAKAVVNDNQDAIKKNALTFARRVATGVLVFLAPTILLALFTFIDGWDSVDSTYKNCIDCLLDTSKCPDNVSLIQK